MANVKAIDPDEFTTLAEFDDAIDFVAEECAKIEQQLLAVKGAAVQRGEYADADWYARANMALRLTKAKKQTLARKRADLSRSLKEAKQSDRTQLFVVACREMLPKETYTALWQRVDEMEKSA